MVILILVNSRRVQTAQHNLAGAEMLPKDNLLDIVALKSPSWRTTMSGTVASEGMPSRTTATAFCATFQMSLMQRA